MNPSTLLYTEITSLAYYVERCHTEICKPCRRHKPSEVFLSIFRVNKLTPLVFCQRHLIRIRQLIGMRPYPYFFPYPRYPCDLAPDRDQIVFFLSSTPPRWFRSNADFPFPHEIPSTFTENLKVLLGWEDPRNPGIGPSTLCPGNRGNPSINSFQMAAVLGWNGSSRLGFKLTEAETAKMEKEVEAHSKNMRVRRLKVAELSRRNRSGAVRRTVRTMKMKRLRSLKAQRKTAEVLKRLEGPLDPREFKRQESKRQESKHQELVLQGLDVQGFDVQGFDPQGLDPQGLGLQGLDLQGLDLQGFDPQGFQSQGTLPQTSEPQGVQPQRLEPQRVQLQRTQPRRLEPRGVQPRRLEPQSVQSQRVQPQGFQPQVSQPQVFQPQVSQPQVFQPQVFQPQIFEPQGFQSQGFQSQGFQLQGFQPHGFQPQGFQPQGSQPLVFGEWNWNFLG
ncbi:hypothetical protein EDB81DRAFT_26218 [Dactylonectria macrodidyma]|uniref:Uncharacterized protein n=1 Tax=Dactylonectria macrodidyma TaxID=307937 RepID=A0A9P9FTR5_9HYPO|nr:hypothetical protein EDB81DRAFT_26218 [Dactylonectria macrodidyma]